MSVLSLVNILRDTPLASSEAEIYKRITHFATQNIMSGKSSPHVIDDAMNYVAPDALSTLGSRYPLFRVFVRSMLSVLSPVDIADAYFDEILSLEDIDLSTDLLLSLNISPIASL